jgi:hypothetical protein
VEIFGAPVCRVNFKMFTKKIKKIKKSPRKGPGGGGPNFIFLPEFLFILVRSPCKNLNSYDNPLWDFNNGGEKPRKRLIYQK